MWPSKIVYEGLLSGEEHPDAADSSVPPQAPNVGRWKQRAASEQQAAASPRPFTPRWRQRAEGGGTLPPPPKSPEPPSLPLMVEVPIVDALDEVPPPASPSSSSLFAPRFLLPATEEAPVVAASTWETLPPAPVAESPTVRIEDLSPPGRSKAKTPEPARPAAVRSASLPPRQ